MEENNMQSFDSETDFSDGIHNIESEEIAPEENPPEEIIPEENPPEQPTRKSRTVTIDFDMILKKAGNFIKNFGLVDMFMLRFISVFFLFSRINLVIQKKDGINAIDGWREFVPNVNGGLTIGLMFFVFIMLTVVYRLLPPKYRIVDQSFAIASILYYDITLLWHKESFNLAMGIMIVSIVFIYYAVGKVKYKKVYNKIPWQLCGIIVLVVAGFVAFFIAFTTIYRHKNFGSSTHDFGLFVQMYHYLAKDLTAVTTCERDKFLSHFYVHASYIFYLLVPVYKIFPYEETLLIAQAVLAMGGVVPLFLIARNHKMKGVTLIFMGLAYAFCIGFVGPCYYDFHENAFLPTLLMWLCWAVDKKNYVMFYIMSVLVCIVKEDAPLYVVCIGMYMFFEYKKEIGRMHGLIMSLFALGYMMFITSWLTQNGDGQMMTSTRFGILMIDETKGLSEVVKNTLADPSYFFSLLFKDDTKHFFFQMMLPMLFLPFFTKKIHRYLLLLPFTIMNLIVGAGYGYAANVGYQYVFGPTALLLYLSIINLEDMGQVRKQELPILMGSAAIIMTIGTYSHFISYYENNLLVKNYYDNLDALLDEIPEDGAVLCDTWLLPHIANRDEVYLFDFNDYDKEKGEIINIERYDFFVIPVASDLYEGCKADFEKHGITLYDSIEGRVEIYKSPLYDLYDK